MAVVNTVLNLKNGVEFLYTKGLMFNSVSVLDERVQKFKRYSDYPEV
jgi:hypothetical protein